MSKLRQRHRQRLRSLRSVDEMVGRLVGVLGETGELSNTSEGMTRSQMALNNDLAPTFADLAGVTPPGFVDGRSLGPLLSESPPSSWRSAFLVEHW